MNEVYFFDSYAIFEILRGNPNYKKYLNSIILTTKLNLFEVYYGLLRKEGEAYATSFLNDYIESTIEFGKDTIKKSAHMKRENKKLSMSDCIGYNIAKSLMIKFLTGDKEFEKKSDVEFIK